MRDVSPRASQLEDEQVSRLSHSLTKNSKPYPRAAVVKYHLPQSAARENGDEDTTGY